MALHFYLMRIFQPKDMKTNKLRSCNGGGLFVTSLFIFMRKASKSKIGSSHLATCLFTVYFCTVASLKSGQTFSWFMVAVWLLSKRREAWIYGIYFVFVPPTQLLIYNFLTLGESLLLAYLQLSEVLVFCFDMHNSN